MRTLNIKAPQIAARLSKEAGYRVLQRKCASTGSSSGMKNECEQCSRKKLSVQRKESNGGSASVVPPIVNEVVRSSGQPLDIESRAFMEPRFGHDFGRVRIHTDARAAASASAVHAHAYTVGRDVVFGHGKYAPHSSEGKKLLAHELAHTIQQGSASHSELVMGQPDDSYEKEADRVANEVAYSAGGTTQVSALTTATIARQIIQRSPDDPKPKPKPKDEEAAKGSKKQDVVVILSPDVGAEASTLAPGIKPINVDSPEALAKALSEIKHPIRTLFILSHALASGDLGFGTHDSLTFVTPSKLAAALKDKVKAENAPDTIDFRGCTIGQSPAAMEEMRAALGAGATVGGNCFLISQKNGPIELSGEKITKPSQLTADDQEPFEAGLKMLIDTFGSAKDCILDKSKDGYFKAGGALVAQWFTPSFTTEWDERKSKCYSALAQEKVDPTVKGDEMDPSIAGHCRLIRVEKPAAK